MDPRLEANRANWDSRVKVHSQSRFYNVDSWLISELGPPDREIEAMGDVKGRTLVHLQCHFGMDTLRWARAGARVTGVDFSPVAIDEATSLAQRAGLSDLSTFICANVYDADHVLSRQKFDFVYVSLGSLGWLPNIDAWGAVVANLLTPGGRLYLQDVHPFTSCLDEVGEKVISNYFEDSDAPFVSDDASTYTDGGEVSVTRTYEWNHSIGEIVGALTSRGLILDVLEEHDWTLFQQFPWLIESTSGELTIPNDRPKIPLSFTIVAHSSNGPSVSPTS